MRTNNCDMVAKDAQSPAPTAPPEATATGKVPLCVDLDGTLVKTDRLWEAATHLLFRHPLRLFGILMGARRGRAWIKKEISLAGSFPVELLPYNKNVIDLVAREGWHARPFSSPPRIN